MIMDFMDLKSSQSLVNDTLNFEEFFKHENNLWKNNAKNNFKIFGFSINFIWIYIFYETLKCFISKIFWLYIKTNSSKFYEFSYIIIINQWHFKFWGILRNLLKNSNKYNNLKIFRFSMNCIWIFFYEKVKCFIFKVFLNIFETYSWFFLFF